MNWLKQNGKYNEAEAYTLVSFGFFLNCVPYQTRQFLNYLE